MIDYNKYALMIANGADYASAFRSLHADVIREVASGISAAWNASSNSLSEYDTEKLWEQIGNIEKGYV